MAVRRRAESQNGEQGQALVEFALVMVLLFLLLFAVIDFSRVFFAFVTMSNGVREGARYAVVHPSDDIGIIEAARRMMLVVGAPVNVTVDFDGPDNCRTLLCPVRVTATSHFPVWTPIVPDIQIQTKATMHIE